MQILLLVPPIRLRSALIDRADGGKLPFQHVQRPEHPLQCTVDWAESILLVTVDAALIYCGWCIEFVQLAMSVTGAVSGVGTFCFYRLCWCIRLVMLMQ